MKFKSTFIIIVFFTCLNSCSLAQMGLYSSVNKKAIKYYEKALIAFNTINPTTGKSNIKEAEIFLKKAIAKDSSFHEAYSLYSNVSIEKGDIESGIYFRNKMIEKNPNVPVIEYYFLAGMQMAVGNYKECL